MMKETDHPIDNICTVEEFAKRHPYLGFSRSRFEYLLKTKAENTIVDDDVLVKVGRNYLIKDKEFCDWYYLYVSKHR